MNTVASAVIRSTPATAYTSRMAASVTCFVRCDVVPHSNQLPDKSALQCRRLSQLVDLSFPTRTERQKANLSLLT